MKLAIFAFGFSGGVFSMIYVIPNLDPSLPPVIAVGAILFGLMSIIFGDVH